MSTPKRHKPKKGGRKTKFRPEYAEQARQLIADGKNQRQCYEFFNVSRQTWHSWKKRFPVFLDALQESLDGNVKKVEDALLKRALGFSCTEVTKTVEIVEKGKKKQSNKEVERHVIADVAAIKFFLVNRSPKDWQNIEKKEITGNDDSGLIPNKITVEFVEPNVDIE